MTDADAIVIGSGHNGLSAAVRLARAGWRVLVLERSRVAGGAICTAEPVLPGYRHDLYATNLSLFRSSLVWRELQPELERAGLRLTTCRHAYASAYEGGRCVRVTTDPEGAAAEFARCSKADRDGWQRAVATFRRIAPHVLPCLNMPLPSREIALQALRAAAALRLELLGLRDTLFGSPRRFGEAFFSTDEAKGAVLPWAMHLDFGPDVAGGAAFAFIAALSAHVSGTVLAEGGAGRIVEALRTLVEERGGVVRTGEEVTGIVVERGRAIGVRTPTGELRAARALIANVTPRLLFGRLLPGDAVPARVGRQAAGFRYGPGVFVIHLALSRPLPWTAAADLARFSYVHLNGKPDELARTYAECTAGKLPERPMMVVGQPTHADPSRAPAGHAVARIQVRAVPAGLDWDAIKESYADRMLEQLEAHAPGAKGLVLGRHVVSPLDLERENPNLIGGDCVSGSHHFDQNYLRRPFPGWSRYRTPLDGLYMVGASTWPGGGVNAASGWLAAGDILGRQ